MDRCRNRLLIAWVEDNGSRAATGEGRQDWGFAYEYGRHLELLKHELCKLESRLFIVDWWLCEEYRCLPRIYQQLVYQTLSQYVLQVVEVY